MPDGPAGRDEDSVVTVTVSPEGEVQRVKLAGDRKSKIDPRAGWNQTDTSTMSHPGDWQTAG